MLAIIITILVSLIFSAFFSGMEIAFVSSNKLKLEIDKKQSRAFNYVASLFSRHQGQYITTLLVGNNIALVVYSIYMSTFIKELLGISAIEISNWDILLETLISTVVIIFAAEFIPKAIVKINPNFYYKLFSIPVYVIFLIFYPISKFSTLLSIVILKIAGIKVNDENDIITFDRVDLANLLDDVADNDSLPEQEKDIKLFQNALDFSELAVRDCMVPRVDIEGIDVEEDIQSLHQKFIDTNCSRLIVYEGTVDNVIGYIHSKSLFKGENTIRGLLKPVEFVPESMPAQKLLSLFIKRHHSMAIVIDEFGGTAGLLTIEDILEEIFGEIEDEHDESSLVERKISDNEYILSTRLEVDYLNDKYDFDIPKTDEYETLAGYIIFHNQDIPEQGEEITISDKKFKILRKSSSKIELVNLIILKKRD